MTHSSRMRILIVEDDGLLGMMLESLVEDLGFQVLGPMRNLQDGLDHALRDRIDFALLDFDLGNGTDALPIAEQLGRRGIPYVFTSGTDPSVIRRSLPDAKVMRKPIGERALELVLAAVA